MKKLNLLLFVSYLAAIFGTCPSHGQEIPPGRLFQWHNAGLAYEPEFPDTLNILDFGALPGGVESCTPAFKACLESALGNTVVFLPRGDYFFDEPLILKSGIKIAGAGPEDTRLIFDLGGAGDLIRISGNIIKDTAWLAEPASKFDSVITAANATAFSEGDLLYLFDSDAEKITSGWAKNSTGQLFIAEKIENGNIEIDTKLRRDFLLDDSPMLIKIEPIINCSVESLSIERSDNTESQTSNILIQNSWNCRVKCVESRFCNFAHIEIGRSLNAEISGSYFTEAFGYGGGGKAYGVAIQFASGDCLIYNNIFEKLRHSVLLQAGPNGNVVSYNYSREPFWTEVSLPSNSAGDLVLHGNYPYANLFEGNIAQNIVIDNSHGINGPDNMFFRNRAELYGIFMNTSPASDSQSFIGNEITNEEFLKGLYILNGEGHFEYSNMVKGQLTPGNSGELKLSSLYLAAPPEYYASDSQFPPIGPPNNPDVYDIEAYARHGLGELTPCHTGPNSIAPDYRGAGFTIYPNPASGSLYIFGIDGESRVEIMDIAGRKALETRMASGMIDISRLRPGAYYLKIDGIVAGSFISY